MNKGRYLLWAIAIAWFVFLLVDFRSDVQGRDCFTWMDPQQYYGFAKDMIAGVRPVNDFEVPSIFPFFIAPFVAIDPSVGTSLWVNVIGGAVLIAAICFIARILSLKTSSLVVSAIVLSSPLLIGLSRSLYLEFWLTALVTAAFAIYLRLFDRIDKGLWVSFAALFYIGILAKMTFPLFFLAPAAFHFISLWAVGRRQTALRLIGIFVVPGLLAVGTVWLFFPRAFAYYLNYGNTAIPIMYLVGPIERWSLDSIGYYFSILSTVMLGAITPFLLLSLFLPRYEFKKIKWEWLLTPRATLWLWLIGPLILLIPQTVKEPRHVAPCIVPAVLLIMLAIDSIPKPVFRIAALVVICVVSAIQYFMITTGIVHTPYFLDRPLAADALQRELALPDIDQPNYLPTPPPLLRDHWRFNQNILLLGFEPNEALAISWALWPAVVVDMDIYRDPRNMSTGLDAEKFQDLSIVSIFNTLNRRCGWETYKFPIIQEAAVQNADYLFVKNVKSDEVRDRYDSYQSIFQHRVGGATLEVYKNEKPDRESFRMMYAKKVLSENPDLNEQEQNTIAFDLRLNAALRGDIATAREVENLFPAITAMAYPRREIYFIAGIGDLLHREVERNIYRSMLMLRKKSQ